MTIERIPNVFYKDRNGKHPLRFIQAYGRTYRFEYDGEDIILIETT